MPRLRPRASHPRNTLRGMSDAQVEGYRGRASTLGPTPWAIDDSDDTGSIEAQAPMSRPHLEVTHAATA